MLVPALRTAAPVWKDSTLNTWKAGHAADHDERGYPPLVKAGVGCFDYTHQSGMVLSPTTVLSLFEAISHKTVEGSRAWDPS